MAQGTTPPTAAQAAGAESTRQVRRVRLVARKALRCGEHQFAAGDLMAEVTLTPPVSVLYLARSINDGTVGVDKSPANPAAGLRRP